MDNDDKFVELWRQGQREILANTMNLDYFKVGTLAGGTTTVGSANHTYGTAEEILANIRKIKEELNGPPLIKVWVGPDNGGLTPLHSHLTDYPLIRESSYLDEDMCFIVAGIGVVAGKEANKKLWEIGCIAIWDENPPN